MNNRILVVEDEPALLETLTYNLERQGYQVLTATDGWQALQLARTEQPDLVLLDVMLPGLDGFDVCRLLRRITSIPILMLTARADEVDKVVGLEMGADDYLTKPFSMRELLARVKAQLRRVRLMREVVASEGSTTDPAPSIPTAAPLRSGNLIIDDTRREVLLGNQPLRLKPKEYDLLLFLVRHRGVALSRDLILERVWGWEYDGNSRTVDVHVRWLREKIEEDPGNARRIVTIRSIGYRFEG